MIKEKKVGINFPILFTPICYFYEQQYVRSVTGNTRNTDIKVGSITSLNITFDFGLMIF